MVSRIIPPQIVGVVALDNRLVQEAVDCRPADDVPIAPLEGLKASAERCVGAGIGQGGEQFSVARAVSVGEAGTDAVFSDGMGAALGEGNAWIIS